MKVYIPFEDGSAVSFDGQNFTVHKRPVGIDADLTELSAGTAYDMWRLRRGDLAKALASAWWKERERLVKNKTKTIYSNVRAAEFE